MPAETLDRYWVPVQGVQLEERVERSRFLALVEPVTDAAGAAAFLAATRAGHHKATHHCSAWRTGLPGGSSWGAADDGEPSGSAGLPILKAIEGSGLSDVVVVVVRWFGGVKLGTGGLVRAYGGVAARALVQVERREQVLRRPLALRFPPSFMTQVKRLAQLHDATEGPLTRGLDLELLLRPPAGRAEALATALRSLFQGKGEVWWP
jgi:uncharacterized YigZ family protein